MKKVIRRSIFETNSSSVHTLTFKCVHKLDDCDMPVSKTGKLRVRLQYFGKNDATFWDQETKLAYLIVLCMHQRYDHGREDFKEQVEELKDSYQFDDLEESIKEHVPGLKEIVPVYQEGWGMDHQASGNLEYIEDFLGSISPAEFVFCRELGLHTTCD